MIDNEWASLPMRCVQANDQPKLQKLSKVAQMVSLPVAKNQNSRHGNEEGGLTMAKEYIERNELKFSLNSLLFLNKLTFTLKDFETLIDIATAADVAEVRHGTWTLHSDGSGTCSECGFTQKNVWDYDNQQRFCGVCGAKMDGERKENNHG